jgi:ribosomal protein L37E
LSYNPRMADPVLQIRCQRCGDQMEMKDPAPGQPWALQQFWVCNRCGRHFWTTYTAAPGAKPATPAPATPGATTPAPTAQAPAAAAISGQAAATAAAPVTKAEPKPETTA